MSADRGCGRREFVIRVAGAALAAVAGASCASVAVRHVVAEGGYIRLSPDEVASLREPGSSLRIQPADHPTPVYVLATATGLVALSPVCTHLGCTVGIEGERLVCPCHGSTYDRRGRVLRGPAERALSSFPIERGADGSVTIDLNGV